MVVFVRSVCLGEVTVLVRDSWGPWCSLLEVVHLARSRDWRPYKVTRFQTF